MTDKILIGRELLFKTEQLLDELRGDINPERGYAEELETEILITRDQLRAALSAPQQEAVKGVVLRDGFPTLISNRALLMPGDIPLYTHPAPSVPEGWQLVPKEPTPEMLKSAVLERHGTATYRCVSTKGVAVLEEEALDDYNAMLSAAPKAPTTDDRKDAGQINYDENLVLSGRMATQTVRLTFAEWRYRAEFTVTVGGNCRGLSIIDAAASKVFDQILGGKEFAELELTDPEGNTLVDSDEEQRDEEWLKNKLIKAEIVSIEPDAAMDAKKGEKK